MGTFSDLETAWAAGLFEGEGCFTLTKVKQWTYARAYLAMTDEDSVRRFHRAVGVGRVRFEPREGYKDRWVWDLHTSADVPRVIALLWPGLGERRRARAKEILEAAHQSPKRAPKTHCVHGHEYTPENTRIRNRQNGRQERACLTCSRKWSADYQRRRREALAKEGGQ